MTDATFSNQWANDTREEVTLPAPMPFDAPVLIGDCISPLAGETVLSLIWRRLEARNEKRPNQRSGRGNR
jgi:hypothetical protein